MYSVLVYPVLRSLDFQVRPEEVCSQQRLIIHQCQGNMVSRLVLVHLLLRTLLHLFTNWDMIPDATIKDIESSVQFPSLKTVKTKNKLKNLERGPETIIFGISVKSCADSTKNQPRRPSLRLFRDIVANSGKIWQFSNPRKSIRTKVNDDMSLLMIAMPWLARSHYKGVLYLVSYHFV